MKGYLTSCIVCRKEYSSKGIFCHYDRAHLGKVYFHGNHGKYDDKRYKDKISKAASEKRLKKLGEKTSHLVNCYKCKKDFSVIEYENKFPSKEKYFCSLSCANSKTHSKITKEKISKALLGKSLRNNRPPKNICCKTCGTDISNTNSPMHSIRLCDSCKNIKDEIKNRLRLEKLSDKSENGFTFYRSQCNFKFNLSDYPDEFDFTLIEKYGWYKPVNRGNNLGGVSRDHMVSCRYGFYNGIDPTIISHPANCKLLRHSDNISKGKKNSLTIDELLLRIEKWDAKYQK